MSPLEAPTRSQLAKSSCSPVNICACIMLPDQSVGKTELGPSLSLVRSLLPLWLSGDADAVIGHATSDQGKRGFRYMNDREVSPLTFLFVASYVSWHHLR